MRRQLLNEGWRLNRCGDSAVYPAAIPSSVYTVLTGQGVLPNPYWKDNEEQARRVMENDFEYNCTFSPDAALAARETVLLRFDGIDTLADIYLNGTLLGSPDNMHRVWEYPVKSLLDLTGENRLRVVLHSPLRAAAAAYAACPTKGTDDAWEGFSHLRKAHCMFGWDWGAHLPDAGIFRDVALAGYDRARIDSVYITQRHENGAVTLSLSPTFRTASAPAQDCSLGALGEGFAYRVSVRDPDGAETVWEESPAAIPIALPRLWWPNGLGDQPLYTVTVTLACRGEPLDIWSRKIGLRTLTMHIEKDEWGESFAHEINGQTIFAMGADYIPEDHLLPRRSRERTRRLLTDCKTANFNSIRVWGGGYYPDDDFYELCDELGFIVWQDFMFACSVYELTPAFEANITQEFIENVKRIRHHACLGLWCGNNEMESFVKDGEWVTKPSEVRDYLFMYERIIPAMLREYDPATFYWPSSPSSGGSFDEPQDPNRGDVHFWQVWHGNKPFSEYRRYGFRYLSEFGFQALPAVKTVEQGISDNPQDQNLFSYVMEKHQRNGAANGKIMDYLQQTYRYPYDFSTLVYASQLLQADGIRYGVEHFRRNRGRCMGAVYWQLNDCWPVISWSSIDYFGRWKALHYAAKRFFAPVLLSCEEQGWMSAEANMNHQHGDEFEKSIRLNLTNETPHERCLTVRWALRGADAAIVWQKEQAVTLAPFSALWLDKELLPDLEVFSQYVSYAALEGDTVLSSGTVIFCPPKYFCFCDPHLTCTAEDGALLIHADAYAKNVELLNENEDLVLSDNYFDMNAGTTRVTLQRGKPEGLHLRSVWDIGRVLPR